MENKGYICEKCGVYISDYTGIYLTICPQCGGDVILVYESPVEGEEE